MANLFDVEPPQWLQRIAQPADMLTASRVVGQGVGAAMKYAGDRTFDSSNFGEDNPAPSFRQDLGEARLNQIDPFWKLKVEQLKLKNTETAAQLASALSTAELRKRTIQDETEDSLRLSHIATGAAGDPDRLITDLSQFVPKSARGVQGAEQLRLAATQSTQRKSQGLQAQTYIKALSDISKTHPDLVSNEMWLTGDNPLPTPEQWTQLKSAQIIAQERGKAAVAEAAKTGNVTTQVSPTGAITTTVKPNTEMVELPINFTDLPNGDVMWTHGKSQGILKDQAKLVKLKALQSRMSSEQSIERQALVKDPTDATGIANEAKQAYVSLYRQAMDLVGSPEKTVEQKPASGVKVLKIERQQ